MTKQGSICEDISSMKEAISPKEPCHEQCNICGNPVESHSGRGCQAPGARNRLYQAGTEIQRSRSGANLGLWLARAAGSEFGAVGIPGPRAWGERERERHSQTLYARVR